MKMCDVHIPTSHQECDCYVRQTCAKKNFKTKSHPLTPPSSPCRTRGQSTQAHLVLATSPLWKKGCYRVRTAPGSQAFSHCDQDRGPARPPLLGKGSHREAAWEAGRAGHPSVTRSWDLGSGFEPLPASSLCRENVLFQLPLFVFPFPPIYLKINCVNAMRNFTTP